ncbi:hypothetical protein HBA55_29435 [Pseudomaricurvus alkylphenolicus]|uniref:hypothetical protein n=1 Tax=Pseudomaricurvus alkylphenolicus TaxID=1306991 RepID=UPI00141FB549|nr:hypothetical protein [Pseudomaricurvus alkylphenolicus]NIB43761.1 hypothetical protein [Pseudomaricurvus alkylphenolicus]
MDKKYFYRKRLVPGEWGLEIVTEKWVSIHETPCFHFCVREYNFAFMKARRLDGQTSLQTAKQKGWVKRIAKENSRFAFDTEEKALEHLRFLKRKQLQHMRREIKFLKFFLGTEELEEVGPQSMVVPKSRDLVHQHYVFE